MTELITADNYYKSGIYAICNKWNGKMYIGSSKNLGSRINEHRRDLKNNKNACSLLQKAYNKYGEKSFCYKLIEYCSENIRHIREKYYLDVLCYANEANRKMFDYSYNIQRIPELNGGNCKYGLLYKLNDKLVILKTFKSITECCKDIKVTSYTSIHKALTECKKSGGFYWASDENIKNFKPHNFDNWVFQLDDNLNIVNKFEYPDSAARHLGCNIASIRKICKKIQKNNYYKGFYWCFQKDYNTFKPYPKIYKYDENFNLVEKYSTLKQASDSINISPDCIKTITKFNTLLGGFYWRYSNDLNFNKKERITVYNKKGSRGKKVYLHRDGKIFKKFINIISASKYLNINRNTISRSIKKYGYYKKSGFLITIDENITYNGKSK